MERNLQLDWSAIVQEAIKRRKEQRLTQKDLAIMAEVSRPVVIKFERQEGNITLESAFRILWVLGLVPRKP